MEFGNKPLRILILEDAAADAELIEYELRKSNFDFISRRAETRETFLREVQEFRPDLILSDYKLPAFDGLSALAICRELCPETPFILVSGAIGEEVAIESIKTGATDFVLKERLFRIGYAVERALRDVREREERKRAEKALKVERQRLRSILETMDDGVCIISQTDEVQYVNPAIEREFGQMSGTTCQEYFLDGVESGSWCDDREVFAGKYSQREWHSKKTGKTYEIFESPFLNDDSMIFRLEIFRDISRRKEAEKSLRESEERYRTLIETMNEGLGVTDEGGKWTYVNERFCTLLGYPCDEIVRRPVIDSLDNANQKIFQEQLNRRKKGGQEPYEISWVRKDGRKVFTQVSPKPIFDEGGEFKGSLAVFTDITERKKSEESLRQALSEIKILKDRLEAENIYFRQEIKTQHQFGNIIGQSNAFKYVLYRAEQVAPASTTVLILGETGTGKELIAAAIHQMSPRKDRALVTVNCAALPANLIESELFGREKGAFTGADARQIGRFELANGSTLCLDEIGELPLELQAKLLRAIQHNEFQRLGSSHTIKVDVRIVATTNRNLEEEILKGRFRQDLYYRLNVFPITVAPLRERKDDLPLLVRTFTERYARKMGKQITSIQKEAMKALQEYSWPGNVRELENVIERAVILCPGPVLQLSEKLQTSFPATSGLRTLEETERDQILKTLSETRWRINGKEGAAAILGLHPSTLRARMQKLGIRRPI